MTKSLACFTFFLVIYVTFTLTIRPTRADEDCKADIAGLAKNCMDYVKFPANPKSDPSEECCNVVKKCNIKCVCDHVTKDIEKTICMEKVVYVAEKCGNALPKGSKCGSYQVPASKMF